MKFFHLKNNKTFMQLSQNSKEVPKNKLAGLPTKQYSVTKINL